MAETGRLTLKAAPGWPVGAVTMLRIALILAALVIWEGLARSGLLYRDVVPSLLAIGKALSGKAASGKTATLELTPDQARILTAAQAAGEISLALVGAGDLAQGDFPTAAIAEPASEIRILKYGRSSQQKTLE